jgi:hypothetical protein
MKSLLALAAGLLLGLFLVTPWPIPVPELLLAALVPFPVFCWLPPGLPWLADGQPPMEGGAP